MQGAHRAHARTGCSRVPGAGLPVYNLQQRRYRTRVLDEDALRTERAVVKLLLMSVFECFGKLPDKMQALVDVQVSAMIPQQEIESNRLCIMIKDQSRAELGFLVITNLQDARMIDTLEDLELSRRMPNQCLPRLIRCCGGKRIDSDAATHRFDADVSTFPILKVFPFANDCAELILANTPVLVRLPDACIHQGPAKACAPAGDRPAPNPGRQEGR